MMKKLFLVIIALFLVNSTVLFGQENDKETVNKYTDRLKVKVLLNDEQAAQVKTILSESLSKLSNESNGKDAISEIELKVAKILDEKQRAKFEIMKGQWLKNLNKEVAVK